jgi:hypothetical protein
MEFWQYLVDAFAWPAWLLVLIPAPVATVAGYRNAYAERLPAALGYGGWAGLVVVLPVTLIEGLFVDAVGLGRSALVGATGGLAVGVVAAISAWIAGLFFDFSLYRAPHLWDGLQWFWRYRVRRGGR